MDEIKKMLKGCVGAVEANSFETLCLYRENKDDWVSENSGLLATVGHINDKPVCISILVNIVKGKRILFYYPTSVMVDYCLIEAWIAENLKVNNKTDAMNFHILFN